MLQFGKRNPSPTTPGYPSADQQDDVSSRNRTPQGCPDPQSLLSIAEVCRFLPRRRGKKKHRTTVVRWMTKGVGGEVLTSWLVGGQRYTTLEAIKSFISRSTTASRAGEHTPPEAAHPTQSIRELTSPPKAEMTKRREHIEEDLKRFGL